jgi:hypothetical protein
MTLKGVSAGQASQGLVRSDLVSAVQHRSRTSGQSKRPNSVPAWLLLTGILLVPSSLAVHLSGEGLKFTPGRAAITLLLVPAFSKLLREHRAGPGCLNSFSASISGVSAGLGCQAERQRREVGMIGCYAVKASPVLCDAPARVLRRPSVLEVSLRRGPPS